jgi:hypothetical protein
MAVKTWTGSDPDTDTSPEHFDVTYEGCVVSLTERNWHDDSDFMAVVWDEATGKFTEVMYATTRGWTYLNSASVDATPEVAARWAAEVEQRNADYRARVAEAEAKAVVKGGHAKVVKGRKVPVGTEGTVIWIGAGRYGTRVGIKDAEGTVHWTARGNVEGVAA